MNQHRRPLIDYALVAVIVVLLVFLGLIQRRNERLGLRTSSLFVPSEPSK